MAYVGSVVDDLWFVLVWTVVGCLVVSNPVEAPPDHAKEKYAWEEDQDECFSAHGFHFCA